MTAAEKQSVRNLINNIAINLERILNRVQDSDNDIDKDIFQNYPFDKSLDEMVHEVLAWRDSLEEAHQ